jgi:phosphoglycerate dehydrogenase-like enzyme
VLAVPLTPETHNLLDRTRMDLMKPRAASSTSPRAR